MRRRFLAVWLVTSAVYVLLAVLGPSAPSTTTGWPRANQHLLQTRSWLGEDIRLPDGSTVEVEPRLDVTPYVAHRVVADPRDEAILANIACALQVGGELVPLQLVRDPDLDRAVCYVGFPLGPSLLLLPLRAALRGALATQWLAALLAGLAVAAADRLLGLWLELRGLRPRWNGLHLTVLVASGTLWLLAAPDGGTFLFAQVVGSTALTVSLLLAWRGRPLGAGAALAFALTSRPPTLLAAPLLALLAWRSTPPDGRARAAARLLTPPLLLGSLQLLLNGLRFGSPLQFGYAYMLTPPRLWQRLQEHGQLDPAFVGDNAWWQLLAPPRLLDGFPWLASDPMGMGILFVTPAFAAGLLTLRPQLLRQPEVAACWLSLVLVTLPALLYFNTGWVQWGGRFLLDAWPLWLLLAAAGLERLPRWTALALIGLSVVSNVWGSLLTTFGVWPGCVM